MKNANFTEDEEYFGFIENEAREVIAALRARAPEYKEIRHRDVFEAVVSMADGTRTTERAALIFNSTIIFYFQQTTGGGELKEIPGIFHIKPPKKN